MSLFGAIGISASGIDAAQTWINTTAGNLANVNDTVATSGQAYATQTPVFTAEGAPGQSGDGVAVTGIAIGDTAGTIAHEPDSPLADKEGNVRVTDVNIGSQMVDLMEAQQSYQANANALAQAKTAYQSALQLGQ